MLDVILFILYGVLLLVAGVALWRLAFALKHFEMRTLMTSSSMIEDIPAVTVCIPARNEKHAMTECLERVIASKYPKLEVIVLDDLSGDNTSSLIKAFAHDGVRFVEGAALPDGWLGKNHALNELLKEASGTYILFMDVDTQLEPDSIERLVAYVQQEKVSMVSVLPRREDGWRLSVIFSTLRYFWEVVFHRHAAPASASNAWMIHRQTLLKRWGGFEPFKSDIQPESKMSAALMKDGQYRFLIGSRVLGVSYEKKWRSQLMTSIRLLYPLLGARKIHAFVAALDLLIIASPFYIVVAGFVLGWGVHQAVAGGFWLLFGVVYALYTRHAWYRGWWLAPLLWPFIVLQEAVLVVVSAIQYERHAITWKGRRVRNSKA